MCMRGLGRSLGRLVQEEERINFSVCEVTETTKMRSCSMLERGITRLKREDKCKRIQYLAPICTHRGRSKKTVKVAEIVSKH